MKLSKTYILLGVLSSCAFAQEPAPNSQPTKDGLQASLEPLPSNSPDLLFESDCKRKDAETHRQSGGGEAAIMLWKEALSRIRLTADEFPELAIQLCKEVLSRMSLIDDKSPEWNSAAVKRDKRLIILAMEQEKIRINIKLLKKELEKLKSNSQPSKDALPATAELLANSAADLFLASYRKFNDAEMLRKSGETNAAIVLYREVLSRLDLIADAFPKWNPAVINHQKRRVIQAIEQLKGN